jgi:hypothetical protein
MSATRLIFALLGIVATIAVVALVATGALQGAHKAGPSDASSPSCLPTTLEHSAKLKGLPVDVSPAPETDTANPYTQISFLGVPSTEIREVSAVGQSSGYHSGRLRAYSQGDGASFLPHTPFRPGERVIVRAAIEFGNARKRIAFGFRVDTPYSTTTVAPFPNPQAAPADYQSFATLPGIQAPVLSVTVADRDLPQATSSRQAAPARAAMDL